MSGRGLGPLVLAVRPFTRGLAFALFESPLSPVDWGIKEVRGSDRHDRMAARVRALIAAQRPDVLVLEDRVTRGVRTPPARLKLYRQLAHRAACDGIAVRRYTRRHIRGCFAGVGAVTRYQIAHAIAGQVHAFEDLLPRTPKIWEGENPRIHLFDAASLVMTYYCFADGEPPPRP